MQQLLLQIESTQPTFDKVKFFHDVTLYKSGCITWLVKKELLEEAKKAIDHLLENQQAMFINQQATLDFIMKSIAAINQQLASTSSSSKQSC